MGKFLVNILRLTGKELRSFKADPIMIVLIVFVFTVVIPVVSNAISTEIEEVAVAVVDEDRSLLSRQIAEVIAPPLFLPAQSLGSDQVASAMSQGEFVLVVEIPPGFEADIMSGRGATLLVLVDATAVAHAGNGAAYLQALITEEITKHLAGNEAAAPGLARIVFRTQYNPNTSSIWFASVTQLMNNITILTMIIAGAALIREQERGTLEHLLVVPVTAHQIVISKIIANGLIVLVGAILCLVFLIQGVLGVPIAGSVPLFLLGTTIYTVSIASLGILLATVSGSMARFGLLATPVIVVMMLLSGGFTPMESMPLWTQYVAHFVSPAPHFVSFSQAVLYRGAGIAFVWPQLAAFVAFGALYYVIALSQFRKLLLSV